MSPERINLLDVSDLRALVLRLDRHVTELKAKLAEKDARIAALEADLAKARKNSSNSSKPPSSDIVKPPRNSGAKPSGKIGGQPGHPRHERAALPPEAVNRLVPHRLDACPGCGGSLKPARAKPRVRQQIELKDNPIKVSEHIAFAYWCPHCRKIYWAPLPAEIERGGLFGPKLTALVAFLKSCHNSFSTIRKTLRDVFGVRVSRGYLAKLLGKATVALEQPYLELLARLRDERYLNVDETGHPENGDNLWTWVFRAPLFTLYRISPSRGSDVLLKVLGKDFDGVIGCDYFSAYRKYMKDFGVELQFCLAHLIRDVKFLTMLPDPVTRNYGDRVLQGLRRLFRVIHRRETLTPEELQKALERARNDLVETGKRAPDRTEAQNLAERFRKHGEAYFRFITTPGIEPTNNLAEQAIRFVVMDRHVTQGTRGEDGRRWCERIWTAVATCAQQGRSVFEYLRAAIEAHIAGDPAPPLVPSSG